jgi:N-acetylglucosamine-6-phosphate deacetylase
VPAARTFLSGADIVLPDRVASGLTLVLEGERIADLTSGPRELGSHEVRVDLSGRLVVPGFVDVHVHGVLGVDVLDGPGAVATVARQLPRFGVTAFCSSPQSHVRAHIRTQGARGSSRRTWKATSSIPRTAARSPWSGFGRTK